MGSNINQNSGLQTTNSISGVKIFNGGNIQIFNQNGTFTVPTGVKAIKVRIWGAGGAGGKGSQNSDGQVMGGCGGGYAEKIITSLTSSYAVTVGERGNAASGEGTKGGNGGTSSFGSVVSATGGEGGYTYNNLSSIIPGVGSGGDINFTGGKSGGWPSGGNGYTGGGSAAGPWGNGYDSGDARGSGVTGGAGIGGRSGQVPPGLGAIPTGGGGSHGQGNMTRGGPGYDGKRTTFIQQSYLATSTSYLRQFAQDGDTTISQPIRFPGEFCWGAGGAGVYGRSESQNSIAAGNGGTGAGGGALYSPSQPDHSNAGGDGGPFGGGGAARAGTGGDGGIGAGGGASNFSPGAYWGGYGGPGLVVVEW